MGSWRRRRGSMEGSGSCLLKKGRRERFREGTWEGSRERLRDRGFLPASWRNSGEARRAAGWTGGQQPRRRRTKARFARCVELRLPPACSRSRAHAKPQRPWLMAFRSPRSLAFRSPRSSSCRLLSPLASVRRSPPPVYAHSSHSLPPRISICRPLRLIHPCVAKETDHVAAHPIERKERAASPAGSVPSIVTQGASSIPARLNLFFLADEGCWIEMFFCLNKHTSWTAGQIAKNTRTILQKCRDGEPDKVNPCFIIRERLLLGIYIYIGKDFRIVFYLFVFFLQPG